MSMLNFNRTIESESRLRLGVEGIYTCRAIKNGKVVRERVFPNLITNLGMDALQQGPSFSRMHLGTGTTPPTFTNTSLTAFGTNVINGGPTVTRGAAGASPYFGWCKLTWTSAVGGATGIWTEIGVSSQNTNGGLRSMALIADPGGSPTSFTVLADEQFEGTYEFRVYVPLVDDVASITLSGVAYTATTRAFQATLAGGGPNQSGWAPDVSQGTSLFSVGTNGVGSPPRVLSSGLVPITDTYPGTFLATCNSRSTSTYTAGNHYVDSSATWSGGALITGIRTVSYPLNVGHFQIEYSPTFNKTAVQQFVHNQRVSWARA